MRADLLALDDDALIALSNRGNFKRAQAELESVTVDLCEADDGTVTARWSDDITCTLLRNRPLTDARCTCPSPTLCRHIIRTVLAYRGQVSEHAPPAPVLSGSAGTGEPANLSPEPSSGTPVPPKAEYTGAGGAVMLLFSPAPGRFCRDLSLWCGTMNSGATVRFLVPGDLNYALCDCGSTPPCIHARAALALLESGASGLVVLGETVVSPAALKSADDALKALLPVGLASAPGSLFDRLRRAEEELRRAGLPWPADILTEIVQLKTAYDSRDARFDSADMARLTGEFLLRSTVLQEGKGAVPALFVGGSISDKALKLESARLVGLGCGVEVRRGGVRLTTYLLDEVSGRVCGVVRDVADPAEDEKIAPRAYFELAKSPASKGISLAELSGSHVLVRGVNRSAAGILALARATIGVNPQGFAWEKLRGSCVVSGFAEAMAHDNTRPPVALRPRRLGESLIIAPIASVEAVGFDAAAQAVVALVKDPEGTEARLFHPFRSRGASGTEALLKALSGTVKFVAGMWRNGSLEPVGLVIEDETGTRRLVQPHIAPPPTEAQTTFPNLDGTRSLARAFVEEELPHLLGDLLVVGTEVSASEAPRWREARRSAEALGFTRLTPLLQPLAEGKPESIERLLPLLALG
ncbi:MAG: SWIM zinc finger family protein [Armatimonas sp.]